MSDLTDEEMARVALWASEPGGRQTPGTLRVAEIVVRGLDELRAARATVTSLEAARARAVEPDIDQWAEIIGQWSYAWKATPATCRALARRLAGHVDEVAVPAEAPRPALPARTDAWIDDLDAPCTLIPGG